MKFCSFSKKKINTSVKIFKIQCFFSQYKFWLWKRREKHISITSLSIEKILYLCYIFAMDYPKTKSEYIELFRNEAEKIYSDLLKTKLDLKKKASEMNKRIKNAKDFQSSKILETAKSDNWQNKNLLNELLLLTYSSYIVMLEYRNEIWPYEYMTFSRRIGELWEPFCKLPFFYPVNELKIIDVPTF